MERRSYLAVVGAVTTAGLAGCIGELGTSDGGDSDDSGSGDDTGNAAAGNGPQADEHGAVEAAEAYMQAAADEDLEAMSDVTHTDHPFDPVEMAAEAEEDENMTFEMGAVDDYAVELADEAYDTDEIRDHPYAEFWFQDIDLDEVLAGEEAVLVEAENETTEDGETVTESETFIMLTEDDEWRVFFVYEEPPEIPDGEPVDEPDPVDDVTFDADDEMVSIDIDQSAEIDELIVYSSSLEADGSVYRPDDHDSDDPFPMSRYGTGFDPDGDEIVITAIADGEELVVHRETYEP